MVLRDLGEPSRERRGNLDKKKYIYFFPFLKLLLITATVNLNKARREQCSTWALLHVLDVPNPREGGDDTVVVTSPSGLKPSPPGEGAAAEPRQKLPNPGTPRPSRAPPELANIHDFFFSFLQSLSSVPMAPGALSGKAHSEKEFILWLRDTGGIFCVGAPSVRTRRQQKPVRAVSGKGIFAAIFSPFPPNGNSSACSKQRYW